MNLQIQCPACERSFRSNDDLTGKTVECGACDHRFEVNIHTIVHEKERFYPGEHQDALLDRLGHSPAVDGAPVSFQRAQYSPQVSASDTMPSTPAQSFAVAAGVILISLFALIFFLGSSKGQVFQDVDMNKRLLLGGFVSLIGSGLIVAGAKTWRNRAILLSTVLFIGVIGMILLRPVHMTPKSDGEFAASEKAAESIETEVNLLDTEQDRYLNRLGYGTVERAIQKETNVDAGIDGRQRVVAVYLHPVKASVVYDLEKFFERRLSIPKTNTVLTYERENGNARLIVLSGIAESFDRVAEMSSELGRVKTLPSKRVIDIKIDTSLFAEPGGDSFQQLTDPLNERFSEANLNEMNHISIERIENAVKRLADMPPGSTLRHKPDIVAKFLELLRQKESGKEIDSAIGRALSTWAPQDKEVATEVAAIMGVRGDNDQEIPKSIVEYLIASGSPSVIALIDRMWVKDPTSWSEQYQAMGAQAESRLAYHITSSPLSVKKAAAVLLRRIGTSQSVPALRAAKGSGDEELKILLNVAIEAAGSR